MVVLSKRHISGTEFWDATKTVKFLQENQYFDEGGEQKWPDTLKEMSSGGNAGLRPSDDFELAFSALGACIWYVETLFFSSLFTS